MKINKLKKYEKKVESPITENQHRANVALAAEKLLTIIEKIPNPAPVAESFDELLNQLKSGDVKRAPVVIHHADGRRIRYDSGGNAEIIAPAITFSPTKNITGGDTENDSSIDTGTFTEAELLILEQFKK